MTLEQWQAGRPPLSAANDTVLLVWKFCGGWNPAVLPAAAAYYGIEDTDFLIAQLLELRAVIERRKAAEGKA